MYPVSALDDQSPKGNTDSVGTGGMTKLGCATDSDSILLSSIHTIAIGPLLGANFGFVWLER